MSDELEVNGFFRLYETAFHSIKALPESYYFFSLRQKGKADVSTITVYVCKKVAK